MPKTESSPRLVLRGVRAQSYQGQAPLIVVDVFQEPQGHWSELGDDPLKDFQLRLAAVLQFLSVETKDMKSQHNVNAL